MAPARKVRGLRCDGPLSHAAAEILTTRLDELVALRAEISGPEQSKLLHDLRIAAKRLRYSLETFAVCFPPKEADSYADRVRALQDTLGRIHDLDVLQELFVARLAGMDEGMRSRALEIARDAALESTRDQKLKGAIHADEMDGGRLGILKTIADKAAERREMYTRFEAVWSEWEGAGLIDGIRELAAGAANGGPS